MIQWHRLGLVFGAPDACFSLRISVSPLVLKPSVHSDKPNPGLCTVRPTAPAFSAPAPALGRRFALAAALAPALQPLGKAGRLLSTTVQWLPASLTLDLNL